RETRPDEQRDGHVYREPQRSAFEPITAVRDRNRANVRKIDRNEPAARIHFQSRRVDTAELSGNLRTIACPDDGNLFPRLHDSVHDRHMKQPHSAIEKKIRVRPLRLSDYDAIVDMQRLCFPKLDPTTREQFESQLRTFPEGQICVDHGGVPIASSSSLIVDF